jgi:oligosaccharide repeat unit polymerase
MPAVVKIAVFFVSAAFVAVNINTWHQDISFVTVLVIFAGLLAFFVGSLAAHGTRARPSFKPIYQDGKIHQLYIPGIVVLFVITVMSVDLWFFYQNVMQVAALAGANSGTSAVLENYRLYTVANQPRMPLYLSITNMLSLPMAYIFLMLFIHNTIAIGKKNYLYLVPVLIYCAKLLIGASRNGFIHLFAITLMMSYIISLKYNKQIKLKTSLRNMSFAIALFVIVFLQLGNLTGKTQKYVSPFQNISIYTGSSIVALDSFINNYSYKSANFGTETIYGGSDIIDRLNSRSSVTRSRFLEFVQLGDMSTATNVYTSYRRLIHDYNYSGLIAIEFVSGYLISNIYLKVRRARSNSFFFLILVYAFLFRTIVESSIEEHLLVDVFTVGVVVSFIVYYCASRLLIRQRLVNTRKAVVVRAK